MGKAVEQRANQGIDCGVENAQREQDHAQQGKRNHTAVKRREVDVER